MAATVLLTGISNEQRCSWLRDFLWPDGVVSTESRVDAAAPELRCVSVVVGPCDPAPFRSARKAHQIWPHATIMIVCKEADYLDRRRQLILAVGIPADTWLTSDADLRRFNRELRRLIERGLRRECYEPSYASVLDQLTGMAEYLPDLPASTTDLLEVLPVGVVLTDSSNQPLYYNAAALELAQGSAPDSLVPTWEEWLPAGTALRLRQIVNMAHKQESLLTEKLELSDSDGQTMILEVTARTSPLKSCRGQTLVLLQNITSRHAAELAKSRFLANMSHEFRTPLNAIIGYGEILTKDKNLDPTQQQALAAINTAAEHMLMLINNVLDLSKIHAGTLNVKLDSFKLKQWIDGLSGMFTMRCQQKGLRWHLETDLQNESTVVGDAGRLTQILLNLLGNAVKFTERGTITLRLSREGTLHTFSVEDTGPGIPPSDIELVTTPFYQVDGASFEPGTGLGLSISKSLLQMMGSELQIESSYGHGTSVSFSVGLEQSEQQPSHSAALTTPSSFRKIANSRTLDVLVVDDIKANRDLLATGLQAAGASVRLAANGAEALEKVDEATPDIIFLDLRMPVLGGEETLKRLKANKRWQGIPCVAVTVSNLVQNSNFLIAQGFDRYLRKPIRFDAVFETLSELLGVEFEDEDTTQATQGLSRGRPPDELVKRLVAATKRGDPSVVDAILSEEGKSFGHLLPEIQGLAAQYDFSAISNLLKKTGGKIEIKH